MGRVKIEMKRIEDRQQQNIAFAKRKNGLLKKAYELNVLCDVQIALILFSPSGKLFVFDAKTRIEETIYKYVALPWYKRSRLQDEQYIRRWINEMRESSLRENLDDDQIQLEEGVMDEVDKCKVQLANVERELGYFLKVPKQWESIEELERQEKLLQKTLADVQSCKKILDVESILVDVSSWPSDSSMEISSVE